MKKTLAMLLAIMMLCALMAGCGQSNQPAASSAASEAAAENNGASEEATSFKVGFIVSITVWTAAAPVGRRTACSAACRRRYLHTPRCRLNMILRRGILRRPRLYRKCR